MKRIICKAIVVFTITLISTNSLAQQNQMTINWPTYFEPKNCPVFVHNEIETNASPEMVWKWLVDINTWEDWYEVADNVNVKSPDSPVLNLGTKFTWETFDLKLLSEVKEFVPNERLAFSVKSKGLDTYHAWLIIPTANGCKIITDETQHGWLAKLGKVFKPKQVYNAHDLWLKRLKIMAEKNPINYLSYRKPLLNKPAMMTQKERDIIIAILNESLAKFKNATSNLTTEQLNFKNTGEWSIFQCIEHVSLAELRFPQIVKEEIVKPANPDNRKNLKMSNAAIRIRLTDRNWKARSPEVFKPSNRFAKPEDAISTFIDQRLKTIEYLKTTNDDLFNHFWRHPATGVVDLYQTIVLMSAHLERHIVQMENVKTSKGYPKK